MNAAAERQWIAGIKSCICFQEDVELFRIIPSYRGQAEEAELAMVDQIGGAFSLDGGSGNGMKMKWFHRRAHGIRRRLTTVGTDSHRWDRRMQDG